jgi:hypothetical protein
MKEYTRDECRNCGRLVEWAAAPMLGEEGDRDLRPFWQRKPTWVDVDPPGEEVWNTHCEVGGADNPFRRGSHEPKHYCNQMQGNGDMCNARVTDDMEELGACRRHLKAARSAAKRNQERQARALQDRWEQESFDARFEALRRLPLYIYKIDAGYVPSYVREHGVLVEAKELLNYIDDLQLQVEGLKREINGDQD